MQIVTIKTSIGWYIGTSDRIVEFSDEARRPLTVPYSSLTSYISLTDPAEIQAAMLMQQTKLGQQTPVITYTVSMLPIDSIQIFLEKPYLIHQPMKDERLVIIYKQALEAYKKQKGESYGSKVN